MIDGLSEDPEDHPTGFIPIIERHNARLKKAHLLHEATLYMIHQKWLVGTTVEDIGKFLQSLAWAPEPYRNKPMPRGMIQALLNIAPNSQAWAPIDLSHCIFRNTKATDPINDVVRAVENLGTSEEPTLQDLQDPKIIPGDGSDRTRTFPRMKTLHDIRRDWLSDEELWLAIPEGETTRHCLTHAPRHSWKLMDEFFLALNTNIGSWIHNLERRDMMLLGSLTENIFGFAGTYARKQQASLVPILTGWKRWMEFNNTNAERIPKDGWLVNLRIAGSITTNTVEKAVSWNVGSHGYQRGKKEIHKIFEQGPPIICLQDVRIPKRRKNSVKREFQRVFPHYWICITTAQSSRTDCRDRPYVYSVLTALHSAFFPKVTQMRCHHSKQMDSDIRREIDGRLSITQAQTPTGTTFQFMNIYQFTAANPTGQTNMWTTTENWINKQKNTRIIMQGDLNCAHPGCRWNYAQPLNKDIGTADNKLERFLKNTSGHSYTQQEHTWKGKECRAALDHVLTWNYHLPPKISRPIPKSHKKFDHC